MILPLDLNEVHTIVDFIVAEFYSRVFGKPLQLGFECISFGSLVSEMELT